MRKLVVLFFLFASINISSQNYTIDTIQVKSVILNEIRSIIIYKPINISITDPVKFIYLLEGENSDYIYQEINTRFEDSISNLIAVGILNPERRRDMLYINGADKFLDFITSELIPSVEKDYKTSIRILHGHSFCGSFTVYSLIHKPECFNYFIASSPTPIMDLINQEDYRRIDSLSKNKIVFCFSFGSKDMKQVRKWSLKLKDNLAATDFNNLDWKFTILEGKNHFNSFMVALFWGLDFIKQNEGDPLKGLTNNGVKQDYR
jgi:predicted alpha/beta superfamily hydrolase